MYMTTIKLFAYSFLGAPLLGTFGSCGKLNPTILAVWAIVLSPLAWNSCWTSYQALWEPARRNIIYNTYILSVSYSSMWGRSLPWRSSLPGACSTAPGWPHSSCTWTRCRSWTVTAECWFLQAEYVLVLSWWTSAALLGELAWTLWFIEYKSEIIELLLI